MPLIDNEGRQVMNMFALHGFGGRWNGSLNLPDHVADSKMGTANDSYMCKTHLLYQGSYLLFRLAHFRVRGW